jgi:glycosyltransferase involved in cell wall biosynthesis
MRSTRSSRPITIFTPSFADEDNTNAQNLTVKEIVARLPPDGFRIIMICGIDPDLRIATRKNTELIRCTRHGNAFRLLRRCLLARPDIYFFPRWGPLDWAFLCVRQRLPIRTALITYVVSTMNQVVSANLPSRLIAEADRVCANSNHVAAIVQNNLGIQSAVVYDGVDRRFYYPSKGGERKPSGHPLVVLYAGSFRTYKRVELVIEHAARHPEVQFRLAGEGETDALCRALGRKYGCGNVAFLGHLAPRQLGHEMRRADIFLFPSILEGHPQVLIQASACGLPAIAMNSYRPESVVNGKTGFLVNSDQELADRLDLLLQNTELRQTMSAAAIRHSYNFDWERIAIQWAEIFQGVVDRRRSGAIQ